MKILYLQMRKDQETADEEFAEFVRFSGIKPEDFTVLNVFKTNTFDTKLLDEHTALFIGGSSDDPEDTVQLPPDEHPYIESTEALIQYAYHSKTPTFASCMGFEIATWVLGGKVIIDKENKEIGTYNIYVTAAGKEDKLLEGTPESFVAVSGHKKRASVLPPGAIKLAYSDLCPIHAYTFADRPFYAFQFHPEIDKQDLIDRLRRYIDRGYVKDPSEFEVLIKTFDDTPHANALLKTFVARILREA